MTGTPGQILGAPGDDRTDVVVIELDEPGAAAALRKAERSPDVVGLVLTSSTRPRRPSTVAIGSGKPVVFALAGRIAADVAILAARCDARVAADGATLSTTELAGAGDLSDITQLVGAGKLAELFIPVELSAARLRELGVVTDVLPDSELIAGAARFARRLAELGPHALSALRGTAVPATTQTDSGPEPELTQQAELRAVPGARSGAQTRQKILDAAARVLRTQGYTACRLADIAKLIGTHQTSLYHYFPSKEALVDEVLRVGVTRTADEVREAVQSLPEPASSLDRLAAAIRAHLRMVLDSTDYAGATIRVPNELPRESYERLRGLQHEYGRYWSQLFADAQADRFLRTGVNLSVTRAFVAGALNYALEWYDPAKSSVDELADEFLSTFLPGLTDPERIRGLDLARIGRETNRPPSEETAS